jgi:SHS family lactate transporter-like MFS transporter
MLSILWFSLFAFLSGFATSYAMLFFFRALFGIGMGGEWAAGMPLTLEHWPAHLRGIASGMLQSGYSTGYILSALSFRYIYPLVSKHPDLGWRAMFWVGIIPALIVLWIRRGVAESPIWLERQKQIIRQRAWQPNALATLFRRNVIGTTLQTSILLGAFVTSAHAMSFWNPTRLIEAKLNPFWYMVALNAGGILGAILWGWIAESSLGRRGAVTLGGLLGVLVIPLYLMTTGAALQMTGSFLIGLGGLGIWGVIPTYLSERFPTPIRGSGSGFAYHIGTAIGAPTPYLIGKLKDQGMNRGNAMAIFIAVASLAAVALIWAGPETKGQPFDTFNDRDLLETEVLAANINQ